MLYTGFYFCAARKLTHDAGFDRSALLPDSESSLRGFAAFLKPGQEAAQVLEPPYANATFTSFELLACPTQPRPK
jgi:hypothetical protein